MVEELRALVNKIFRSYGYEIRAFNGSNPHFQERVALEDPRVGMIVDVGANAGQYAQRIRRTLPKTPIRSFEPLPDAFQQLRALSAPDPNWEVFNCALGRKDANLELVVAGNSQSSSFLPIQNAHLSSAPESASVGTISVPVKRLDSFIDEFPNDLYLKIDTQGYELEVLSGGPRTLSRAMYVYLEVSFTQLYGGAPLAHDVMSYMYRNGFELWTLTPGFSDQKNARLLQADMLFGRHNQITN